MNVNRTIHGVQFQWGSDKADSNWYKHKVTFESACEIFFDPFLHALEEEEVEGELRGSVIGLTANWQILYVVYSFRGDIIRLISARTVTRTDRLKYENQ